MWEQGEASRFTKFLQRAEVGDFPDPQMVFGWLSFTVGCLHPVEVSQSTTDVFGYSICLHAIPTRVIFLL